MAVDEDALPAELLAFTTRHKTRRITLHFILSKRSVKVRFIQRALKVFSVIIEDVKVLINFGLCSFRRIVTDLRNTRVFLK